MSQIQKLQSEIRKLRAQNRTLVQTEQRVRNELNRVRGDWLKAQIKIRKAIGTEAVPSDGHDGIDHILGLLRVTRMQRDTAEQMAVTCAATTCAQCGAKRFCPIRNDRLGGYVCLTCIDRELQRLQYDASAILQNKVQAPPPNRASDLCACGHTRELHEDIRCWASNEKGHQGHCRCAGFKPMAPTTKEPSQLIRATKLSDLP